MKPPPVLIYDKPRTKIDTNPTPTPGSTRLDDNARAIEDDLYSNSIEHPPEPHIEDLKIVTQFIAELKAAILENSKLGADTINRPHRPPSDPIPSTLNPFLHLSFDIFRATENSSEWTYDSVHEAIS